MFFYASVLKNLLIKKYPTAEFGVLFCHTLPWIENRRESDLISEFWFQSKLRRLNKIQAVLMVRFY